MRVPALFLASATHRQTNRKPLRCIAFQHFSPSPTKHRREAWQPSKCGRTLSYRDLPARLYAQLPGAFFRYCPTDRICRHASTATQRHAVTWRPGSDFPIVHERWPLKSFLGNSRHCGRPATDGATNVLALPPGSPVGPRLLLPPSTQAAGPKGSRRGRRWRRSDRDATRPCGGSARASDRHRELRTAIRRSGISKGSGVVVSFGLGSQAGPAARIQGRLQPKLLRRAALPLDVAKASASDDRSPQTFELRFRFSPVDERCPVFWQRDRSCIGALAGLGGGPFGQARPRPSFGVRHEIGAEHFVLHIARPSAVDRLLRSGRI